MENCTSLVINSSCFNFKKVINESKGVLISNIQLLKVVKPFFLLINFYFVSPIFDRNMPCKSWSPGLADRNVRKINLILGKTNEIKESALSHSNRIILVTCFKYQFMQEMDKIPES